MIAVDQAREPQSESENDASCDFTTSILKMTEQFLNSRKVSTISHETDLAELKRTREDMLQVIERFKKFKQTCESAFLQSVKVLEVQIEILEKQLTGNSELADLV